MLLKSIVMSWMVRWSLRLCFFGDLVAQAFFLLPQLGRELSAEILGLEHLSDFDLRIIARHGIGAALDPFDRFLLRLALPDPETGDEFLGLGERAVNHGSLAAREPDPRPLGTGLQSLARQHDASLDEFLI